MFPLGDDNPTVRTPVMNYLIIAVTLAVWVLVQGAGSEYRLVQTVCDLGMIPGELTHLARVGSGVPVAPGLSCLVDNDPINVLTPLISIFLHGGWMHVLGNMWYLWIFGDNVEDPMGSGRYLVFYLICGLAAAAIHVLVNPASIVPTVGASGAISGVMGAYLVLYPRAHVRMWLFLFVLRIPAWVVLIFWFGTQLLAGLPDLSQLRPDVSSGVAVWAHVGGFIAGALLIKLFENPRLAPLPRREAYGEW